jgi:tRNA pseudouridine13 synthase
MTKLVFEEANIGQAMSLLERKDRLEKSILMVLRKSAINYYNAFQNIARNTRTIFVHAY